ncbi:uncharacterized protein N7511_002974 [Penicillium nucicola]|uniref:uncharacterized protein n=1 Tax=Penicillium nucicola TaxID=1850975 RepID=UPI002545AB47|nr:uncharacterized protein N7511_002974 [Penicillium nucicola]KAJ5770923.1 hypothetical protein N7511_002974 [Penicillium nucicola]
MDAETRHVTLERWSKSRGALASAADPPSAAALAEHKDNLDYQPEDNIEVFEIFVSIRQNTSQS